MQSIEDPRTEIDTCQHVAEHSTRDKYAMERYVIRSPKYIFNIDESSLAIKRMLGLKRRYGVRPRDEKL